MTPEEVTDLIAESVGVWEEVFSIREAAAYAIADEWEKRWAHDRLTMDRWTETQTHDGLRAQLTHAEASGDLRGVHIAAEHSLRRAREALATAQGQ